MDHYRAARRSRNYLEEAAQNQAFTADPAPDADALLLLRTAMDGLNHQDQELLRLRYLNQLSFAELGQVLGFSEQAAKETHRLLQALGSGWEARMTKEFAQLEQLLRSFAQQGPSDAFTARLRARLANQQPLPVPLAPPPKACLGLCPAPAGAGPDRFAIGPRKVLAQFGRWFGFLPNYGFIQSSGRWRSGKPCIRTVLMAA